MRSGIMRQIAAGAASSPIAVLADTAVVGGPALPNLELDAALDASEPEPNRWSTGRSRLSMLTLVR